MDLANCERSLFPLKNQFLNATKAKTNNTTLLFSTPPFHPRQQVHSPLLQPPESPWRQQSHAISVDRPHIQPKSIFVWIHYGAWYVCGQSGFPSKQGPRPTSGVRFDTITGQVRRREIIAMEDRKPLAMQPGFRL